VIFPEKEQNQGYYCFVVISERAWGFRMKIDYVRRPGTSWGWKDERESNEN
jgi:hypothetical protein